MAARRLIETVEADFVIELYQGLGYSRTMTYYGGDGEPVNLTGKIISIKFKDVFPNQLNLFSNGSPSPLGSFLTITDAGQGEFRFQLTDDETATAARGTGGKWILEYYEDDFSEPLWIDKVCVKEL